MERECYMFVICDASQCSRLKAKLTLHREGAPHILHSSHSGTRLFRLHCLSRGHIVPQRQQTLSDPKILPLLILLPVFPCSNISFQWDLPENFVKLLPPLPPLFLLHGTYHQVIHHITHWCYWSVFLPSVLTFWGCCGLSDFFCAIFPVLEYCLAQSGPHYLPVEWAWTDY